MNKIKTNDLIARLIERVISDTTDQMANPAVESSAMYTNPERFQREREILFLDTPQVIAFAGEVAEKNSYLTAQCMGIPIVVTRDSEGQLRAFINACGHRGARVAEGCGTKKRLNCGFHGWTYALDGSLAARPKEDCFASDKSQCGLVALPVSDRSGMLVVGLRPEMAQARVDCALDDISSEFSGFAFDKMHTLETRRYEVAANWKLVVSLSHEAYHFSNLHRNSLAPMMTSHGVVDEFGLHTRWAFAVRGIEKLLDKPREQWPARLPGAINHTIFPGTVVIVNPEDAQMIRVEPGATAGTSVVYYSGVCADVSKREESLRSYAFGGDIFADEDLPAAEQCQHGLAATGRDIIVGKNEPVVQMWHRRWADAIKSKPL